MKEQVYNIIFWLAAVAYFVPAVIVILKKLYRDRIVSLFAIYWTIGGTINIADRIPGLNTEARELLLVGYNLLDIPLVLFIFHYATTSTPLKKFIQVAGFSYVIIEVVHCIVKGMAYYDSGYVVGIGVLITLVVIGWELFGYVGKMEQTNREKAMIFIYAAMLFEYASYVIIFVFEFFSDNTPNIDNLLIYYTSALMGVAIASIGFLSKNLQDGQRQQKWDRVLSN